MITVITLLVVLTLSILITRVATVALTHTGLSREAARFQARSAFTGVGFTTAESEKVVNHPVRRRILMLLMLLGNAGIVTAVSSLILTFVQTSQSQAWLIRIVLLIAGLAALLTAAHSRWLDRHLSNLVSAMLSRWTDLDVRDYATVLHVGRDYRVAELHVEPEDWLSGKRLGDMKLRDEGIAVLGLQRPGGEYLGIPGATTEVREGDVLLVYGRGTALARLDERRAGIGGELEHGDAVAEQVHVAEQERTEAG